MRKLCVLTGAALVVATWGVTPVVAAPIVYANIDIQGSGAGGQRTEPDFIAPPGGPVVTNTDTGDNNINLATQSLTSATGDSFTFAISNVDVNGSAVGTVDWRDRGDATNPPALGRLAEDFVKNNSGVLRITLGSLPAGSYDVISYHVDPDNTQSDQIQVRVSTDGGSTFGPVAADTGSAGLAYGGVNGANFTTANIQASSANFSFVADGTNNVVIVFDGRPSTVDDETPLNGLQISTNEVPEPSAVGLLGVAAAGLLARRRRR